jgi:hypothetical protein
MLRSSARAKRTQLQSPAWHPSGRSEWIYDQSGSWRDTLSPVSVSFALLNGPNRQRGGHPPTRTHRCFLRSSAGAKRTQLQSPTWHSSSCPLWTYNQQRLSSLCPLCYLLFPFLFPFLNGGGNRRSSLFPNRHRRRPEQLRSGLIGRRQAGRELQIVHRPLGLQHA